MTRTDAIRADMTVLTRGVPFRPFVVNFENGDRAVIQHPENIAFDGTPNGRDRLFVITDQLVHYSTLSAVTSVSELDVGQPSNAS